MAILNGIATKLNGSAGSLTFRRSSGRTIVSEKANEVKNTRTSAQQRHRMKWANVVHVYAVEHDYEIIIFKRYEKNFTFLLFVVTLR